jgi:ATP-binding cassette subfamily B protein
VLRDRLWILGEALRLRPAGRRGERHGAITLVVSHRFSTVRMADLIVVLEAEQPSTGAAGAQGVRGRGGGRIVEQGSHAALMSRGGLYAELYTLQASAYANVS